MGSESSPSSKSLECYDIVRAESAGPQVRNAGETNGVVLGMDKVGE